MKKLIILCTIVLLACGVGMARDRVSRNVKDLPQAAQNLISTHFGGAGVSHIKIDRHTFGGTDYEVVLNNGTEIEFDSQGAWREIDCGTKAVPSKLILPAITKYVSSNYSSAKIVKIEINRRGYDVELNSGLDLKFARDGRFLRIDD